MNSIAPGLSGPRFGRRPQPGELSEAAPAPIAPPPLAEIMPEISVLPPQAAWVTELRTLCLAKLDPSSIANSPPEELIPEVELLISEIATEKRIQLNGREQRQLATELVDDMLGLGPLEPLLEDETINDIMVNGPSTVFVERRGKVFAAPVRFRDTAHLTNVCQRIAAAVGRRVDETSPMVDARLKDGSRVNIVLQPLALDGPYVSIRKFSKKSIDFNKLIEFGAMTRPVARVLEICAQIRLNVIISGGTGSGKTTMLNAMSRLIDHGERVVTVEDAAELQLQQPHVVRLETRPANLEGKGEINQRDLVKNALRMRPDRIIIGEVRGSEAFDMLQAMNTGHDGSMSTIHANNTRDAITRIENMVQMGSMGLPLGAIRTQIVSAVDLILQVERQRDGGRRLVQVTEVCGMEGDMVLLNDIFHFKIDDEGPDGRLRGHYDVVRTRPSFQTRLNYFRLDRAWVQAIEDGDDTTLTTILMMFAFIGLSGLGFSAFLVMNGQNRQEKIKQRFANATAPHMRVRKIEIPRLVRTRSAEPSGSPLQRLGTLFGFNVARPEIYPTKWYVVVGLAFVASRLIAGVIVSLAGSAAWVTMPFIWVLGSRTVFNMFLGKRRQKLYSQFPDCLAMIVRSVRAGVPLTEAIRIVGKESPQPAGEEFRRVASDISIGTPLADALKSLADRNEITEFRFLATALTLQAQTGGRLGETLENLGGLVRKRMAVKSRGKALAAEARTTAWILGGLPLLAMGALYLLNPEYISMLFTDPSGRSILMAVFVLLFVGGFSMKTIIQKSLS